MDPDPLGLLDGDTEVVGSLGELVDELINLIVRFLVSFSEGGVDTGPVRKLYTGFSDLLDLKKTILNKSLLALGSDDPWWV